ncbi:hypothetical protein EDB86DRAFT_3134743 [Lactarius hatsudake]|nr:hypothetical protein EDB86DRAFT_3134743 [Lactarius hatsudake]
MSEQVWVAKDRQMQHKGSHRPPCGAGCRIRVHRDCGDVSVKGLRPHTSVARWGAATWNVRVGWSGVVRNALPAPFCVRPLRPFTCKWGAGEDANTSSCGTAPLLSPPAPLSAQMGHANPERRPPPTPAQERCANGRGVSGVRHPLIACSPPPIEWSAHAPRHFPPPASQPARPPPLPNWHAPFAYLLVRKRGIPTGAAKWGGAQAAFAPTPRPTLSRPLPVGTPDTAPCFTAPPLLPFPFTTWSGGTEWRSGGAPPKRVGKLCARRRGAAPALVRVQMGHANGGWGLRGDGNGRPCSRLRDTRTQDRQAPFATHPRERGTCCPTPHPTSRKGSTQPGGLRANPEGVHPHTFTQRGERAAGVGNAC